MKVIFQVLVGTQDPTFWEKGMLLELPQPLAG